LGGEARGNKQSSKKDKNLWGGRRKKGNKRKKPRLAQKTGALGSRQVFNWSWGQQVKERKLKGGKFPCTKLKNKVQKSPEKQSFQTNTVDSGNKNKEKGKNYLGASLHKGRGKRGGWTFLQIEKKINWKKEKGELDKGEKMKGKGKNKNKAFKFKIRGGVLGEKGNAALCDEIPIPAIDRKGKSPKRGKNHTQKKGLQIWKNGVAEKKKKEDFQNTRKSRTMARESPNKEVKRERRGKPFLGEGKKKSSESRDAALPASVKRVKGRSDPD